MTCCFSDDPKQTNVRHSCGPWLPWPKWLASWMRVLVAVLPVLVAVLPVLVAVLPITLQGI